MSQHSDITVRLSVPLVLAQVVKTRRHLGDARMYVCRCLSDLFELACSICHCKHNYSLPQNGINQEYANANKWSTAYDPDTTPSRDEVAALDDDTAHVSFSGLRLISPFLELSKGRFISPRKRNDDHTHTVSALDEISAVIHRLQQSQKSIGIIGGNDEARSFLYPSTTSRMTVQVDSTTGALAEDVYTRVDRLLEGCARQYDFLTGCPKSSQIVDIFSISQPSVQVQPEEKDEYDDEPSCERHAFESDITFDQAPSTLDSTQALAWIDIATQTVTCCRNASESYFSWQLSSQGEFTAPNFAALELVSALGVQQATEAFYRSHLTTRNDRLDEAVAEAMIAISVGNPLGALALQVANAAVSAADLDCLRDRIKLRLLTGGYGWYPREYTRRALAAIGVEGVNEIEEEESST